MRINWIYTFSGSRLPLRRGVNRVLIDIKNSLLKYERKGCYYTLSDARQIYLRKYIKTDGAYDFSNKSKSENTPVIKIRAQTGKRYARDWENAAAWISKPGILLSTLINLKEVDLD